MGNGKWVVVCFLFYRGQWAMAGAEEGVGREGHEVVFGMIDGLLILFRIGGFTHGARKKDIAADANGGGRWGGGCDEIGAGRGAMPAGV